MAIFAPKSTLQVIIKKLYDAFNEAMENPDVRARMEAYGAELFERDRRSPEYLQELVQSEIKKWAIPIKASGVAGQ